MCSRRPHAPGPGGTFGRLLLPFLLALSLVLSAPAAPTPTADDPALSLDPQIRSGRLDNGLSYFIRVNSKPENRAALRLAVNAGSVLEEEHQRGLAHFLEHMAFNGTEHFEKQELVDFLEGIGMRFGPELNAYTGFDETVYLLEVPVEDPAVFEKAFLVLRDWAGGLLLDPQEIEKERGVILEEWRLGRGAQQRVLDKQLPALLHNSLYAERLPIGTPEIIRSAPRQAFVDFYRDWYRPDLMAVIVVGDIDADQVENLIRNHFAPLDNPDPRRPRPSVPVPDHSQTLVSIATDPELPYTSVEITTKRQAQPDKTEADYRRSLVEGLYRQMLNDRLDEEVQKADPPFLFAGVGLTSFARETDVLVQTAVVREDAVDRGLTSLLMETRRVAQDGFTAGELGRASAQTLRKFEQAFNERDKTPSATHADELVRHFLSGEPVPGISKELDLVRRFLGEITLAEVNATAREWLAPTNRVVLFSAPDKPQLTVPSEEQIRKIVRKAEEASIVAYDDDLSDAPLVPHDPAPGPVKEEIFHERIGVTEWRLANGVRVLIKPTDFKNDQVLVGGFSPGGHSLVSDEEFVPAATANDVVLRSGLGTFNQVQLQKKLAGKIARATTGISEQFEVLNGTASPQDLPTLFELIYLRFTAPRADEDAFQSLLVLLGEVIENRLNDPAAVYADAVELALYNQHPRHQPLSKRLLQAMNRQASLRIYRERFADASDFTFVLVGNLKVEDVRPWIERYLGSLPATGRQETGRFNDDDPVRGQHDLVVRKGIEPKASVQILFTGDAPWSDEERYPLRAAVDILQIQLRELLREDLGGTYGVRVSGDLTRWPKGTYACTIKFGCDPAKVADLTAAALAELKRLQEEGPSQENLAKVKEQHLRSYEVGMKENGFWLGNLVFRAQNGLELAGILDFPEKPGNLTADAVTSAARKYFNPDNRFIATLLPETPNAE